MLTQVFVLKQMAYSISVPPPYPPSLALILSFFSPTVIFCSSFLSSYILHPILSHLSLIHVGLTKVFVHGKVVNDSACAHHTHQSTKRLTGCSDMHQYGVIYNCDG